MMATIIRPAKPADAAAIAAIRVETWRTTYKGLIPDAYLASMKVEDSEALWAKVLAAPPNRTNTFVAEKAGNVIGFASGLMLPEKKHELDAELSAVYIRRDAQRAGVGKQLVSHVAAAQRDLGATGLIVWVIAGNRMARNFYESLGAQLLVEQPFTWDGMDLVEAGYGWRDLGLLIRTANGSATLH
jgi:ribosomal protein S18 acetylase RimI-like enzyme